MRHLSRLTIAWRLFLLLVVGLLATNFTFRSDFAYTSPTHFATYPDWIQSWLAPWANFDGVHYLEIAAHGYTDQGRFLPFFPGVIALANLVFLNAGRLNTLQLCLAFIIVQGVFVAMLLIWQKVWQFHSTSKQFWPILAVLAFPTSFFLVSIYTESLFLLLAGLVFLLIAKKKFAWAILPAALLTITRLTGVFILPVLLWSWWQHDHQKLWLKAGLVSLAGIPLFAYSYYNFVQWGDWLYFVYAHSNLANGRETSGLVFPLITIYRYGKILLSLSPSLHEWRVALLELGFLGLSTALLILSWLKKYLQAYVVFAALAILLPIFSGTLSGLPRYSLVILPLLPAAVHLSKKWQYSLIITGFILQILLLVWFSQGYFVA